TKRSPARPRAVPPLRRPSPSPPPRTAARRPLQRSPRLPRRAPSRNRVRALLQRVRTAEVRVDQQVVGRIGPGWTVLLGVGRDDDNTTAKALAHKIVHIRAFADDAGRMNRSALEVGAEVLVVSQFTLYAALSRGRRPYFGAAAPPETAEP